MDLQAQDDAQTLARAKAINNDPARLLAAQTAADAEANKMARAAVDMKKIGKEMYPRMMEQQSGGTES